MKVLVNGAPAPSHSSVTVDRPGVSPPNAKAELLPVPVEPPNCLLAALKLFCSLQEVPFHNSVLAVVVLGPSPPKDNPSV